VHLVATDAFVNTGRAFLHRSLRAFLFLYQRTSKLTARAVKTR
jgi:hypothetical protein